MNDREQLNAAVARAEKAEAERDAAVAKMAALRDALAATWPGIAEEEGFINPGGNITIVHRLAKAALHDTEAAAYEYKQRIVAALTTENERLRTACGEAIPLLRRGMAPAGCKSIEEMVADKLRAALATLTAENCPVEDPSTHHQKEEPK